MKSKEALGKDARRFIEDFKVRFESYYARELPILRAQIPSRLYDAMYYSLDAGGKRLRPALCAASGQAFGAQEASLLPLGLALEMFHTGSLIHDDLPSMDNDTLRRGKPTNHVVFGEATALLAGGALFVWPFQIIVEGLKAWDIPSSRILESLHLFAQAIGPHGVCGGQALDLEGEKDILGESETWKIASKKTAALIKASVQCGAIVGGASREEVLKIGAYGEHLGLAFQIVDDILDVVSNLEVLGKTPGKDEILEKQTFVRQYGLEGAKARAREETEKALQALQGFEDQEILAGMACFLENRIM